jgi:hypothetical protein
MRLFFSLCILVMLTSLVAGTVTQQYDVSVPSFSRSGDNDNLQLDNSITMTRPGEPAVPSIPVRLLLNPGEKAVSVTVHFGEPIVLDGTYRIPPMQEPVPTSLRYTAKAAPANRAVYDSDAAYPAQDCSSVSTQFYRGHGIAMVTVNPIKYHPVSGRVEYYPDFTIEVTTAPDENAQNSLNRFLRSDDTTLRNVRQYVDNPGSASMYPEASRNRDDVFPMLIITGSTYVANLDDFVALKIRQGFHPMVSTTADIYASMTGEDNQDKIRNYIISCYQTFGTEYVILAGDVGIVPYRGFSVHAGETIDDNIPSDLYYASLDRVGDGNGPDWNVDNDTYWGEQEEADFYPEISIGRFSATNATQFQAIVNKQVMYESSPVVADLDEAQMVGEQLNDNPVTWGGDYKDEVVEGGNHNGFTTVGFPDNINIHTKYERDGYWASSNLASELNSGRNIVNHMGHSNTDYNMKFYLNDVTNSTFTANGTNHNFYFIYSQGCYAAAFDDNSIAEKFCNISNGCFAYLGNSRYGWYNPGGTDASSQYFDRQFFDAVFGEDITRIGDANNDSKLDGASQCSDEWFRWTFYELNLFGDPSADLWTAVPGTMNPVYASDIPVSQTIITVETGVAGAMVGISRDGSHVATATAGANGIATINFGAPFTEICTLDVTITAHNYAMHEGQIHVISANGPYVVMDSYTAASGDDTIIAAGETATLSVELSNLGSEALQNGTVTLSSSSTAITIVDGTESVTTLNAGEQANLASAFSITVASSVADGTTIPLTLSVSSEQGTWNSTLNIPVRAPVISGVTLTFTDGDGVLIPGANTNVEFHVGNIGGAPASNLTVTIAGLDAYLTLTGASGQIPLIEAGEEGYFTLGLTCDDATPQGYMAQYGVSIVGDNGLQYSGSVVFCVGEIQEGFESGNFTAFPWETSGDADWTVTGSAYEGSYCASSGNISDNQESILSMDVNIIQGGSVGFRYKVSCENDTNDNYDYLCFLLDGLEMDRWDGTVAWTEATFPVTAGSHVLTWKYHKDGGVSAGSDCGWIDNVTLPPYVPATAPSLLLDTNTIDFGYVEVGQTGTFSLSIYNLGNAPMSGTFSTPEGYSIALTDRSRTGSRNDASRNDLDYSLEASGIASYLITFAPTEETDYTGRITMTSNDPFHQMNIITVNAHGGVTNSDNTVPQYCDELQSIFPNPFNPEATVQFSVKQDGTRVRMDIFNARGQKIRTILDNKMAAGTHLTTWNGVDDQSHSVGSGVYLCRLIIGNQTFSRRMMLVK